MSAAPAGRVAILCPSIRQLAGIPLAGGLKSAVVSAVTANPGIDRGKVDGLSSSVRHTISPRVSRRTWYVWFVIAPQSFRATDFY
jgi:hypothetical protein